MCNNNYKIVNRTVVFIILCCFLVYFADAQNPIPDTSGVKSHQKINEVVVTGTRATDDIRHIPMSLSVITANKIAESNQTSLLPLLTEQVPGLFTTSRGAMGYGVSTGSAGSFSIRGIGGSPTTRVLVLIDGHPQYMGLMGHPIADVLQSVAAQRVEVIRGPASVLYGSNAMAGVINIVTQKLKHDTVYNNLNVAYGSFNTFTAHLTNNIKKNRFSHSVGALYNKSNGHRQNMDFEQYGAFFKAGYKINNNINFSGYANINSFTSSNPGTVETPLTDNDSEITRLTSSVAIENNYPNTNGALKMFYNYGRHKINDGYKTTEQPKNYRFNSYDNMFGINWYQTISVFNNNIITVGADYQNFGGKAWNQFTDSTFELANKNAFGIAGYFGVKQNIGSWLALDISTRADYYSETKTELIPQAAMLFYLPSNTQIKAIAGKGYRIPSLRELYMFVSQNPGLKAESIVNYEIAVTQNLFNNKISYGANLFYIDGKNIIQTIIVEGRGKNVNTAKIKNYGFETELNYNIDKNWGLMANYSFVKMEYPVLGAPANKLYAQIQYTNNKINLCSGAQYVSGLYTLLSPATKQNFLLVNVRGSYNINKNIKVHVKAENILGANYYINTGYPMPKATVIGGVNVNF